MTMTLTPKMSQKLEGLTQSFKDCPKNKRLALLSSYAKRLPVLPEQFKHHGFFQDETCKTPFYVAIEKPKADAEGIHFFFDAPKDALLTWAFGGILHELLEGLSVEEVVNVPVDFYKSLDLDELLSDMRLQTLGVMLMKSKLEVRRNESA